MRDATPQSVLELVQNSGLTYDEQERVKQLIPGDKLNAVSGDKLLACPEVSVPVPRGTVEQSAEGWRPRCRSKSGPRRATAYLLAATFRRAVRSPAAVSVRDSWRDLLQVVGLSETADETLKAARYRQPVVLSGRHAIGYWLSKAIRTGWLDIKTRRPKTIEPRSAWLSGDRKSIWVTKTAIQSLLENHRLSAWDLTKLFVSRNVDPLTCNLTNRDKLICLQLSLDHADRRAKELLPVGRRTAEQKKLDSEKKTGSPEGRKIG